MSRKPRTGPPTTTSRSGSIVICLLVFLSVVLSLLIGAVQTSLRSRMEVRNQLRRVQADQLCEAGYHRAISQLRQNTQYASETWRPNIAETSFLATEITIQVADDATNKTIRVHVLLKSSEASTDFIHRTKTFPFSQPPFAENKDE